MDKYVAEWNGRVIYYSIFAVLALLIIYLFFRYLKKQRTLECTYCGRKLHGRPRYKDTIEGRMKVFCDGKCHQDHRANGPMSGSERQVRRAEETIEEI